MASNDIESDILSTYTASGMRTIILSQNLSDLGSLLGMMNEVLRKPLTLEAVRDVLRVRGLLNERARESHLKFP
jgi:hypothetical protein